MDGIRIIAIDVHSSPEADLRRLNVLINTLNAETDPDDAPRTFDAFRTQLETAPPFHRSFRWLALRDDEAVGYARAGYRQSDDNQHAIGGYVGVLPDERRRRLGSELLGRLVATAGREGKRTLFIDGDSSVAAGNAFLERLGGRHGITMEINALKLSELDRDLMQSWIDRGKRLGSDYQLLDWRDDIPEEHFERFVELIHVMNSAPTENLDLEDFVLTPEQVRHYERARKARGQRLWTRIARHRGSGALAGYTELHWDPSNPPIFQQADTAVDPAHRGHGLGRWLKAANLLSAMQDMPAATWVRTGNAGSNEAMLAINRAMGFKLHKTITGWQFEIEALAAALQARRAAAGAGA